MRNQAIQSDCIFCEIVAGNASASFVYHDKLVTAFMDIQPVNPGHLLIVPNDHAAFLADLDERIEGHIFSVARRLAGALRQSSLRCEGVNLFLADGEAAGQDVFHVHLHVLPRFPRDGFRIVLPKDYGTRPSRTELDDAAEDIRRSLG